MDAGALVAAHVCGHLPAEMEGRATAEDAADGRWADVRWADAGRWWVGERGADGGDSEAWTEAEGANVAEGGGLGSQSP